MLVASVVSNTELAHLGGNIFKYLQQNKLVYSTQTTACSNTVCTF